MEGGKKIFDTSNESRVESRADLKEKSPIKIQQQKQESSFSDESSLSYAFRQLSVGNGGVGFESLDYPNSMLPARNEILHSDKGKQISSDPGFDLFDGLGWDSPVSYNHNQPDLEYRQKFESLNVPQPYMSSPSFGSSFGSQNESFGSQNEDYHKLQQECRDLQKLYHHRLQAYEQQTQLSLDTFDDYYYARALPSRIKQQLLNKMPSTSHGCNSYRDPDFRSLDGYSYNSVRANRTGAAWPKYDANNSFSPNPKPMIPDSIYAMAKDQHGCRHLQKAIVNGDPMDVRIIFNEILLHVVELMTHPFGNYLIQKLLEVCNEQQLTQILYVITRNNVDIIRISCDMHGTRAIQKIVQTVRTLEQVSVLVSSLRLGIVTLIKNMNGNHVAQRCLTYLAPEHNEFLFEVATNHCLDLATDCHGCCVIQKCLSHSNDDQKRRLTKAITFNALILSQNIYGNYVVQCTFDLNFRWATMEIVDRLAGAFWDLSIQKCSSNVIEKCLQYGNDEARTRIVRELLHDHRFEQIMHDPFGNYVIQAALKFSTGALHEELVLAIRPYIRELETSPYGKKVLSGRKHRKY